MAPKVLLIDNYDSFTYNLVQAFLVLGAEVDVHRNDAITVQQALAQGHSHLVISPGPGTPRDAGVSMRMIEAFAGRLPIFGVCLGSPVIGRSIRRQGGACRPPDAWQGVGCYSRRQGAVQRRAAELRGGPLSFVDRAGRQHPRRARSYLANRARVKSWA